MTNYYLGADMGGTLIKIAIVDDKANVIEEAVVNTDINASPKSVIENIVEVFKKFKNYNKVKTIGIGIAGDIDFKQGIVRFSPNLPKWNKVQLKKDIEKLTGKTVFVDNDANTAAIGAYWLDVKAKADNMVCVTLGTGVGGGIIINKKLFRGNSGTAGEIGHITVVPDGRKCNCGNYGCAETYIGVRHIVKETIDLLKTKKSKYIVKLANNDIEQITPKLLSQAAEKGDVVAKKVWNNAGEKLGILLADIIDFFNPDCIVLCGGISNAGDLIIKPAKEQIKKRAFKTAAKACKIIVSKYTSKLGVVGAAMLVKN
ncbi:ROK family protein [Candidatus Ruminimicrobiellum ovillum]|uniref:ROK family protein n=1 Tax=Candidatus Ruminimicrobiellum ovillum TaxID=1947927 RepID=UPI0035596A2D